MYIYVIENRINGKMYIGKTQYKNPNQRWSSHKSAAMKRPTHPIAYAIVKYGAENFSFIPFRYCETAEQLNQEEIYWIAYMRWALGRDMIYNVGDGGEYSSGNKGRKMSEEQKRKISESRKKNPNAGQFKKGIRKEGQFNKGYVPWNKKGS